MTIRTETSNTYFEEINPGERTVVTGIRIECKTCQNSQSGRRIARDLSKEGFDKPPSTVFKLAEEHDESLHKGEGDITVTLNIEPASGSGVKSIDHPEGRSASR